MAILAMDESLTRSSCGCGSLLSAVAMGLNMPLQATVRPTHAMRQANHVAATSLCIACDSHGSNVANEALIRCVNLEGSEILIFQMGEELNRFSGLRQWR